MINKRVIALSLISAFVFFGCSSKQVHKNDLVKDQRVLKQSPLDENVLYYMNKDFDVQNYNKVNVKKIFVQKTESSKNVDEKVLNQITSYLQSQLQERLTNVVKNNPNNDELDLQIAIPNIDVSYKDLAFYQYLPYGLAFTALKRGTGFEQRKLNIQLVLKLTNSKTNITQVLLVDNNKPKDTKDYKSLTFENIKPQLDSWIDKYELRFRELNNGKYDSYLTDKD